MNLSNTELLRKLKYTCPTSNSLYTYFRDVKKSIFLYIWFNEKKKMFSKKKKLTFGIERKYIKIDQ